MSREKGGRKCVDELKHFKQGCFHTMFIWKFSRNSVMFFLGSCFTICFLLTEVDRSREPELASKNGKSSIGELGASKNKSSSDPDKHTRKSQVI